jgi:murein DD-endopeptidase MepM/ murein hydrolase activator NlpD
MKRTSRTAALAASLICSSVVAAIAADDCIYDDMPFETARSSEERLLGGADETARHLAHLPFTREIAAAGIVGDAFASALAESRVPATVVLEVRKALAGTLDVERELGAGDRFYVRYRQPFTVDGTPIGTAQLIWLELRTTAKGTVGLHRFRPNGGTEQLWLANGEAAGSAALRLPLDVINVSSGFGLRPDPLDKPGPPMGPLADPAPVAAAPAPEPPPPPKEEPLPPPRRPTLGGLSAFGGARDVFDSGRPDFHRRRAEPEAAPEVAKVPEPPKVEAPPAPPPPPKPRLFMHDGLDLVAMTGTEIYAAADGVVTGAGPNGGYGNWMQIDHPGKLTTVYGHLSAFAPGIEAGTRVSQGELVGFVGNTGRSTGAHLHFEIVANGRTVNPLTFAGIKRTQLTSGDLDRFKKQVKRSLDERDREARVDAVILGMLN